MDRLVELSRHGANMKILQVIHSVNPRAGGTTEALRQFSSALVPPRHRRRGAHPRCGRRALEPRFPAAPACPWHGPRRLRLRAGRDFLAGQAGRRLRRHLGQRALAIRRLAVWRAARRTGRPYCVYPHGMLDPWFKRRYPLKHLKKWLYWPWGEYRVLRDAAGRLFHLRGGTARGAKIILALPLPRRGFGLRHFLAAWRRVHQRALFLREFPGLAGKRLFLFHRPAAREKRLRFAFARLCQDRAPAKARISIWSWPGHADNAYAVAMKQLSDELGDFRSRSPGPA